MNKTFLYLLVLIATSTSNIINCPTYLTSWMHYRYAEEGPWSFASPVPKSSEKVQFKITRQTDYMCLNSTALVFQSKWRVVPLFTLRERERDSCTYYIKRGNLEMNKSEWNSNIVNVNVEYQTYCWSLNGDNIGWSNWIVFDNFVYVLKNCDKSYWSNWIETSNCKSSLQSICTRWCTDCDGFIANQDFCAGNTTKFQHCRTSWGEWGEAGSCNISGIVSKGERTRKRKCLHENGTEAFHAKQCSDQSPVMTEQCYQHDNESQCKCQMKDLSSTSSTTNVSGLYIGIGITVLAILLLNIVLALLCYRRYLSEKLLSNNEVNRNPLPRSSAIDRRTARTSASTHKCMQLGASNACELRDELEEVAAEYSYIKAKPTTGVLDVTNPQKAESPDRDFELSYSTIQKPGVAKKRNVIYSSLSNSYELPATEDEYSTLSSR